MALIINADIASRAIQSALARAAANRQAGRLPVRQPDGSYLVPSANSKAAYVVKVLNLTELTASCTCAHGQRPEAAGRCWHTLAACAEDVRRLGGRYLKIGRAS